MRGKPGALREEVVIAETGRIRGFTVAGRLR
jgi:hypothetical protein